jgi:hypothetical protein
VLNKQVININFQSGLDTKTDPFQVPIGKFLSLENSVFDKGGRLTKRNGFQKLTSNLNVAPYLTTLNDNLTTVSSTIDAYNADTTTWVSKGTYYPLTLSTLPLIRNSIDQIQCDSIIAANGLVCTVYSESQNGITDYKYVIADSVTGQNIVSPTLIPAASGGTITGSPRVFLLGIYFIIVFTNVITSTPHLQYIAISSSTPASATVPADIASAYVSSTTVAWDGVVFGSNLYLAYNSTTGGQSVKVTYLPLSSAIGGLPPVTARTYSGSEASMFTLAVDATLSNPIVYISFYSLSTTNGYTLAVDLSLNPVFAPTQIITAMTILNLASAAQNNVLTVFSEVSNNYTYDSSIPTHYINGITVSSTGTVGTQYDVVRSVGLASKACIVDGVIYFLAAYQSPFQPTYFLIDGSTSVSAMPIVVSKLAYENGGGYLTLGLPSITVVGNVISMAYLYKDFISSLTVLNNTEQTTTGGVYSQTGINMVSFTINSTDIDSVETAGALHIGGGFLWEYDAYLPVEHNFFLWPDSVEATWSDTGGNMVANPEGWVDGFPSYYYQAVYSWADNQGNIHRSAPSIPVAITLGTDTSTTGSVTIDIPTLRLTYKIANPLKIEIYRWSVAQQVYHLVTSLTSPILNTLASDSISFVDTLADTSIEGNAIIYTEGGVLEDVNAPATSIMTLYDSRLWMVDAEDPNLLWFSKQVIENVPVEMSDLLTFYVAPTIGVQGSTGPMRALAPMDDKICIFKKDAIYYINGAGQGPDNTGTNNGYSQPIFITSVVGCQNQQSIVFMPQGLMFQSDKGIWLLDRFTLQASYIGSPVEQFTQYNTELGIQPTVESAVSIPATNQVRFTMNTGVTLMYDYFYQQWGTFVGIPAISSCIYQSLHTFLNAQGLVYQEDVNSSVDGTEPVLMNWTTSWINIAQLQGFERAYYFYLLGQTISPYFLTMGIAYNYNPSIVQLSTITPRNYSSATPSPFGNEPAPFGSLSPVQQNRVFFKQQKCQSFQITMQEYFDYTSGVTPGPGLTVSGIAMVAAIKRGVRPIAAIQNVG